MKKYFVLGSSIAYSLSPVIHSELYKIFGDDAIYTIKDVAEDKFDSFMQSLSGYDGFNVTKPYKERIVKYLDTELCSVNTVIADGMKGYSTDGDGFLFDFTRLCGKIDGAKVLLVGYGGAATAVVNKLKQKQCKVFVVGRDCNKADEFVKRHNVSLFCGQNIQFAVNCASGSMQGLPPVDVCYDLRYSGETLNIGKRNYNGLGMLIAQAIYSYGLFTDKRFDFCDVERLYLKIRERI